MSTEEARREQPPPPHPPHLAESARITTLVHLLAHQVRLDLRNERRVEHAGAVTTSGGSVRLGLLVAVAVWIVLGVDGNERGHAKAALVLLAHLRARALGRHHDHSQVGADLHPLLDDVEAVRVGEGRALAKARQGKARQGKRGWARGERRRRERRRRGGVRGLRVAAGSGEEAAPPPAF